MTAPTLILSAPQGWGKTLHAPTLRQEYGCTAIVDEWHPRNALTPGALHLTQSHPSDIEDWGHDRDLIIGRGWPCKRDNRRAARQHGNVLPAFATWLAACALALLLAASWLLDGPSDHSFEVAQARDLEAAQRTEATRLAQDRAISRACSGGISGNAGWVDLPDGRHRCATSGGRATGTIVAGAQP